MFERGASPPKYCGYMCHKCTLQYLLKLLTAARSQMRQAYQAGTKLEDLTSVVHILSQRKECDEPRSGAAAGFAGYPCYPLCHTQAR